MVAVVNDGSIYSSDISQLLKEKELVVGVEVHHYFNHLVQNDEFDATLFMLSNGTSCYGSRSRWRFFPSPSFSGQLRSVHLE